MERQFEYNKHKYWVKVEPSIHEKTGQTVFTAYVGDEKSGTLLYGKAVKNPDGTVMLFETESSALLNANAIKQSELGKGPLR